MIQGETLAPHQRLQAEPDILERGRDLSCKHGKKAWADMSADSADSDDETMDSTSAAPSTRSCSSQPQEQGLQRPTPEKIMTPHPISEHEQTPPLALPLLPDTNGLQLVYCQTPDPFDHPIMPPPIPSPEFAEMEDLGWHGLEVEAFATTAKSKKKKNTRGRGSQHRRRKEYLTRRTNNKTKMCEYLTRDGACPFGGKCWFAHCTSELLAQESEGLDHQEESTVAFSKTPCMDAAATHIQRVVKGWLVRSMQCDLRHTATGSAKGKQSSMDLGEESES